MNTDEISERFGNLDTDDVAEKRFQMFKIFEEIVESQSDSELKGLKEVNGYLYKLSQEFLLSSSTMEKERKLEKIIEYVS